MTWTVCYKNGVRDADAHCITLARCKLCEHYLLKGEAHFCTDTAKHKKPDAIKHD